MSVGLFSSTTPPQHDAATSMFHSWNEDKYGHTVQVLFYLTRKQLTKGW